MKSIYRAVLVFSLMAAGLITFTACPVTTLLNQTNTGWWAWDYLHSKYYQMDVLYRYAGAHCIVYVEQANQAKLSVAQAQAVANTFDNSIYSQDTSTFGTPPSVSGDGKITILVLDIIDGWSGGGYIAGFFDPNQELDNLHSNKKDMLFMDCNPGTPGDSTFNMTLAHEFQHMINFNQKVFVQGVGPQDTWINEGLSTAAESVYLGAVNTDRVNYYNSDPEGTISNGMGFVYWQNQLANYSTVYLFFQWLRYQSGGVGIFKDIITNLAVDYTAVVAAAQTDMYITNWHGYLGDWYIANYFQDPANKYGYKGNISPLIHPITTGTYSLNPGGGIYRGIGGSGTANPSGNIDYAGLQSNTGAVDTVGATYTGLRLLAFNFNGNALGGFENASFSMNSLSQSVNLEPVRLSPELEQFKRDFLSGRKRLAMDTTIEFKGHGFIKKRLSLSTNGK